MTHLRWANPESDSVILLGFSVHARSILSLFSSSVLIFFTMVSFPAPRAGYQLQNDRLTKSARNTACSTQEVVELPFMASDMVLHILVCELSDGLPVDGLMRECRTVPERKLARRK